MATTSFSKTGTKSTTAPKLDSKVFNVEITNHDLLKTAYVVYLSNQRTNNAVTKTRGLVSGGGRKPWRQKGTGNARVGSIRSPLWRGGGITFGPTGIENYTKRLNIKSKRLATKQALSIANKDGRIIILEDFVPLKKTNEAVKFLNKIGAVKSALIVVESKTDELVRAIRNLQSVKLVQAKYINVFDLMNADHIVITKKSLDIISEWLGAETK